MTVPTGRPPGKPPPDLTGVRFGRLVVLSRGELHRLPSGHGAWRWNCVCDCGATTSPVTADLRSGKIQSCGCFRDDHRHDPKSHGMTANGTRSGEYRSWECMKQRCLNPRYRGFKHWGGRGITVCARWLESFENFLADIGPRPSPRHSLDRYPDNDGNYEPGNCRWATRSEQRRNQRATISPTA